MFYTMKNSSRSKRLGVTGYNLEIVIINFSISVRYEEGRIIVLQLFAIFLVIGFMILIPLKLRLILSFKSSMGIFLVQLGCYLLVSFLGLTKKILVC